MLGFAGEPGTNKNFIKDELVRGILGMDMVKRWKIWSDEKCLQSYKR